MKKYWFYIPCLVAFFSCGQEKKATEKTIAFTVERAPEWTSLFKRSSGWFGGDGIFTIPYNGREVQGGHENDSVLFLFSDTMVGEIKDDVLQPGFVMVNNSVAMLTGIEADESRMRFRVAENAEGKPATLFVPNTPTAQPGQYYWLGDGFVNHARNNDLYIFAYRIENTDSEGVFSFREVGNALLVIPHNSRFPFKETRQLDTPFFFEGDDESGYGSFGAGILVNTKEAGVPSPDGYVYVYGVRGKSKELMVARIKPAEFEQFSDWEFWKGTGWGKDREAIAAIEDSVSNELSVTALPDGRYVLIYQYGGIYPQIYLQVGESPVGPFGERQKVWDTRNDITDPDLFMYNAKAHPVISKPGELLVSYNVNSFKFFDIIKSKPDLYRPRFVRIRFN